MYRILSIDGGGIYGLHFITQIKRLEDAHPGFLKSVDLVAGTSIGGIIALGIANETPIDNIINMFITESGSIFSRSLSRKILFNLGLKAKYDNKSLKNILIDNFGDKLLKDLSKKVVVPSFQVNSNKNQWKEKVFHNFSRKGGCVHPEIQIDSLNQKIVDVGLSTSAAPTFFPAYDVYIDGAVTQNNPSMQALAFTQDESFGAIPWGDIRLISIGCNYDGDEIKRSSMDWGAINWLKYITKILLKGNMVSADYQCKQLLGYKKYFRLCSNLPPELSKDMDSVNIINNLSKFNDEKQTNRAIEWIGKNWGLGTPKN